MKGAVREALKQRRAALSEERRRAQCKLDLPYHFVLSFASLPDEINLTPLNLQLALEGRLLLPRIEGEHLIPYHVHNIDHLIPNTYGILEPDPARATPATTVDVILVPALGFDHANHRIGYGKGFYDRLLPRYPTIPHIGIGFKEQFVDTLPTEPHDIALTEVILA